MIFFFCFVLQLTRGKSDLNLGRRGACKALLSDGMEISPKTTSNLCGTVQMAAQSAEQTESLRLGGVSAGHGPPASTRNKAGQLGLGAGPGLDGGKQKQEIEMEMGTTVWGQQEAEQARMAAETGQCCLQHRTVSVRTFYAPEHCRLSTSAWGCKLREPYQGL